ncbi:MAG: hypothetical protein K6G30_12490, partial [Acetatifactor sp.]|nr:hypothetical protein [Acetatifactor sp.]
MKREILVLLDREEDYVRLMAEYLNNRPERPWDIHVYTLSEELIKDEAGCEISMLVVAESVYEDKLEKFYDGCTVILNESGLLRWENKKNVDKYQPADFVYRNLLEIYADNVNEQFPRLMRKNGATLLGLYSPVRRSLQTSFAFTLCNLLAPKGKVLYMNFEPCAGISEMLPDMQTRDLADLMFFLNADESRFQLRFQTIVRHKGDLDYVPPMKIGQNIMMVPGEEWIALLNKICNLGI